VLVDGNYRSRTWVDIYVVVIAYVLEALVLRTVNVSVRRKGLMKLGRHRGQGNPHRALKQ